MYIYQGSGECKMVQMAANLMNATIIFQPWNDKMTKCSCVTIKEPGMSECKTNSNKYLFDVIPVSFERLDNGRLDIVTETIWMTTQELRKYP